MTGENLISAAGAEGQELLCDEPAERTGLFGGARGKGQGRGRGAKRRRGSEGGAAGSEAGAEGSNLDGARGGVGASGAGLVIGGDEFGQQVTGEKKKRRVTERGRVDGEGEDIGEEARATPLEAGERGSRPKQVEEEVARERLLAVFRSEEGLDESVARLVERVKELMGLEQCEDAATEGRMHEFRAWFWEKVVQEGVFRWSQDYAVTAEGLARSVAEALASLHVRDALFGNIEKEVASALGASCASGGWAIEGEDWRVMLRIEVVLRALSEWEKWLFDEGFDEFACRGCAWENDRRCAVFKQCPSRPGEGSRFCKRHAQHLSHGEWEPPAHVSIKGAVLVKGMKEARWRAGQGVARVSRGGDQGAGRDQGAGAQREAGRRRVVFAPQYVPRVPGRLRVFKEQAVAMAPFPCMLCEEQFATAALLEQHVDSAHCGMDEYRKAIFHQRAAFEGVRAVTPQEWRAVVGKFAEHLVTGRREWPECSVADEQWAEAFGSFAGLVVACGGAAPFVERVRAEAKRVAAGAWEAALEGVRGEDGAEASEASWNAWFEEARVRFPFQDGSEGGGQSEGGVGAKLDEIADEVANSSNVLMSLVDTFADCGVLQRAVWHALRWETEAGEEGEREEGAVRADFARAVGSRVVEEGPAA